MNSMEWKLLQEESQLKELIKAIKKECKGHFYTNYQFLNSTTDDDINSEILVAQNDDNIYSKLMDYGYLFCIQP